MQREIMHIIKEWKKEAHVDSLIQVSVFAGFKDVIKICTDKPGWLIGRGGTLYDHYLEKLKKVNPHLQRIEFIETDSFYIK